MRPSDDGSTFDDASIAPLILSELGLKAALEDLLHHWSLRSPELNVTFSCPDEVDTPGQKDDHSNISHSPGMFDQYRSPCQCQACPYYLVLTKSTDISRHTNRNTLQLSIKDDGQGCATENLKSGFGLLSIRERISSLGGQFTIQSMPQQGMQILASIPLS